MYIEHHEEPPQKTLWLSRLSTTNRSYQNNLYFVQTDYKLERQKQFLIQYFLSEILYRIKRIISAQQFAFRYPPDIVNFPSLGS